MLENAHRVLGPGPLENVHEETPGVACGLDGTDVQRRSKIPALYRGQTIGEYKPDMRSNKLVIVEIKSVARLAPVFEVQTLTGLRITNKRAGLLVNFNSRSVKDGTKRYVL